MRSDMHKVICGEPRHGGGRERHFRRANLSDEFLPKTEGMRRPHRDRKWFGEHLGPLRRWLRSQLGRPWDDIYSEACAVIKPDSIVRNHIKLHLLQFVERRTFIRDGQIWCFATGCLGTEKLVEENASLWSPFYVHPQTGLLCEVRLRRRIRRRDADAELRAKTQRWLNENTLLRELNGIWFECSVNLFPPHFVWGDDPTRFDVAERRLIGPGQARSLYGKAVFCHAKRQLSRRELRGFGVRNSAHV